MKVARNIGIIIAIILYSLMSFYVANTINNDLINAFSIDIKYIVFLVFAIGTVLALLTMGLINKNVGALVGKIGTYSFGFSIISFFLILITNLFGEIIFLGKINESYFSLVQLIIIFAVFLYGRYNASKIKITNYNIKIDKKSSLNNLNLVLISDLHLGYFNDNKKFKKNIDKINSLNPDAVVIAGDVFDGNFKAVQNNEETRILFNSIKSKYGTFLNFGNHDAGETFKEMKSFVESTNINLLEDNLVKIEDKLAIAGRKDMRPIGFQGEARKKEWNEAGEDKLPIIVLEHEPVFDEYNGKADLVLSGHTHKGQIFPFNLATKMYYKNHYGYLKFESGLQTIVTSGLGTWGPPIRIGSRNEIAKINITFK